MEDNNRAWHYNFTGHEVPSTKLVTKLNDNGFKGIIDPKEKCLVVDIVNRRYLPSFCNAQFPAVCLVSMIGRMDILIIGEKGKPEALGLFYDGRDCGAKINFLDSSVQKSGRPVYGAVVAYLNGSVVLCGGKVNGDQCSSLFIDVTVRKSKVRCACFIFKLFLKRTESFDSFLKCFYPTEHNDLDLPLHNDQ